MIILIIRAKEKSKILMNHIKGKQKREQWKPRKKTRIITEVVWAIDLSDLKATTMAFSSQEKSSFF